MKKLSDLKAKGIRRFFGAVLLPLLLKRWAETAPPGFQPRPQRKEPR